MGLEYAGKSQRGNEHNAYKCCNHCERNAAENLELHSRCHKQSSHMGLEYADQSERGNEHNAYEHCNHCERNAR